LLALKKKFFWKIACTKFVFHWKNYFHWKIAFIENTYLHWNIIFLKKTTFIEKIASIEKFLSFKNLFALKKYFQNKFNSSFQFAFKANSIQIQNFRFFHMHNCFKYFLSIVNNTCLSLVAMEPQKNLIFESLILNDECYNEHHMLEKWWHSLHDNL